MSDVATYHTADGTLIYDVNYYVADEQHTDIWIVRLTEDQAVRVRMTLEHLADDEIIGWWECKPRTVSPAPLDELGARLNQLLPRGRRART